jgi:predicted nucleotidyltransferase
VLRYPPLGEPYATALREAVAFIFDRFTPCGIVAAGTIVRGNPSPSSDLDVYVLHHAPERQRIQRRFAGVPAEIFVNPPARVERYLDAEAREGRPITAHMLSTGFAVYAGDECLAGLRRRGEEIIAWGPDPTVEDLVRQRYGATTLFEDAADVAASDPETAVALLTRAVEEAIRYAFWAAGVWQPRHKDVLRRLGEIDAEAAHIARAYYRGAGVDARFARARALLERLAIPTGFFEWESARESC